MTDKHTKTRLLEEEIIRLEERIEDLKGRWPAHSVPPALIAELDSLDEQLEEARARLASLLSQHAQSGSE